MKGALKLLGYLLIISGFTNILPIGVALLYRESLRYFLLAMATSLLLGTGLVKLSGIDSLVETIGSENSLILGALSFITISSVGAITYLPYLDVLGAYFEAVSGYTTTGLSVFQSLEGLPKSLLFWRAMTQWIGGLGIIIVFLLIFSSQSAHSLYGKQRRVASKKTLYLASGYPKDMGPSISIATKRLIIIYFGMTLLGFLGLRLLGTRPLDAISLTFASLSTGGFAVTDSLSYNTFQLSLLALMMLTGSLPFVLYAVLLWDHTLEIVRNKEVQFFMALTTFFAVIGVLASNDPFKDIFNIISAASTTGFSLGDLSQSPPIYIFLLLFAMFAGGCTASTAGGVKQVRIAVMLKSILWSVKKTSAPPSQILNIRFAGKVLSSREIMMVLVFILLHSLFFLLGSFVLLALGNGMMDSLFLSISALSTVGLSTVPVHALHPIAKVTLILEMLLGRLEIFPMLLLGKRIVEAF